MILLAVRTPGWFAVPDIPRGQQQPIRDDLERMTDQFSQALLEPQPFSIELTQTQLNHWLTMRDQIWAGASNFLPPAIRDPLVGLAPQRVTVGMRYQGVVGLILSADIAASVDGDDIIVRLVGVRLGSLPIPASLVSSLLGQLQQSIPEGVRGNLRDGLRVPAEQVWWNGKRRFRVVDITIENGLLRLGIQPMGPAGRR